MPDELREASVRARQPQGAHDPHRRAARPRCRGIVSGALLAVARAAGETAPLLFTIGTATATNPNLFNGPNTALSVQIFANAQSAVRRRAGPGLGRGAHPHRHRLHLHARRPRRHRAGSRRISIALGTIMDEPEPNPSRPTRAAQARGRCRTPPASDASDSSTPRRVGLRRAGRLGLLRRVPRRRGRRRLTIHENEITAFIGPSGCGKTTVLRCLNRMNDLIPGARVDGDVHYHGDRPLRRRASSPSRCAGASAWCSRSRTRSRSRSTTTSPTGRASTASQQGRARRHRRAVAAPGRAVGRGEGPAEEVGASACPAASSSGSASPARSPSSPTSC